MLYLTRHQWNANWNNEMQVHTYKNGWSRKHWQHQMLKRMCSNRNSHWLFLGNSKMVQSLWKTIWWLLTKHNLPIWSRNYTPWYLLKRVENFWLYEILYMNVYSSLIHNCPNLEATKMFFVRRMDKWSVNI